MFWKAKSAKKNNFILRGDFRQLPLLPLLFPKVSESLKILDIRLWKVGAKRRLNGTSKVNRQTDGQTDKQTDGGPMLYVLYVPISKCLNFFVSPLTSLGIWLECWWKMFWFWASDTSPLASEETHLQRIFFLLFFLYFKSCIRATLNLLMCANSGTDTKTIILRHIFVRQNLRNVWWK